MLVEWMNNKFTILYSTYCQFQASFQSLHGDNLGANKLYKLNEENFVRNSNVRSL